MHVLVTCKYKKDWIKNNEKRWRHHFPHYKSMGAFCCHGNQSFDPICPKTVCSLSPTPVMLHIKFDQDWPTGFRDIRLKVWTTTPDADGRQTIGILYAHLVSLRVRWAKNRLPIADQNLLPYWVIVVSRLYEDEKSISNTLVIANFGAPISISEP